MTTDSRDSTGEPTQPTQQLGKDQLPSITLHELVHKVPKVDPRDRLDAFTRAAMMANWNQSTEDWVEVAQEAIDAVDRAEEKRLAKSKKTETAGPQT